MAVEDLTTYTETDPNSRITVTSARSSWASLTKNEDAFVYKDKGVAHFSGDYEHLVTAYLDACDLNSLVLCWALTNLVDDLRGIDDGGGDEHCVGLRSPSSGNYEVKLYELYSGSLAGDAYVCSLDTAYYLKIKRDEGTGANGTLYCYIYSDSARTNLLDTLTLALNEKEDFRYIYVTQTYVDGAEDAQTAYSENLDLQEVGIARSMHHYRMMREN